MNSKAIQYALNAQIRHSLENILCIYSNNPLFYNIVAFAHYCDGYNIIRQDTRKIQTQSQVTNILATRENIASMTNAMFKLSRITCNPFPLSMLVYSHAHAHTNKKQAQEI